MDAQGFWRAVLDQRPQEIRAYMVPTAVVSWPNTGERFTVEEFIRANCEYPGRWDGRIERLVQAGPTMVTAVHVYGRDGGGSFHVTSFMHVNDDGLIDALTEYWGDDGPVPQWRQDLHIGRVSS